MDENNKVQVFVVAIIGLIIGSYLYSENEKEKEKVKVGDCLRIRNSIDISNMEETQAASQGYSLFSTYKRRELVKEKYGVKYCFELDDETKAECRKWIWNESIKNGQEIRKPYKQRQAQLKQMYEDKQCSAKNRFDTTPTYSY